MVELFSPLSPEKCGELLRGAIKSQWSSVGGWERRRFFRLRVRSPNIRNSFRTFATVTLIADGPQTRIECRFGVHPVVKALMGFWFCVIVAALIFELVKMWGRQPFDGTPFVVLPFMLLFGFGLVLFGRRMARGEDGILLDFVQTRLQARVLEQSSPP